MLVVIDDMSRKVAKVTKRRLTVFGTLSLIAIVYFCITLGYHLYTIFDLHHQKNELENTYSNLQKEADDLQIEINKLNDPDYLARYAREKFSYSKDGEYIIKINETEKEMDNIDDSLNINYVVVGLSGLLVMIFIYIIVKSRKK